MSSFNDKVIATQAFLLNRIGLRRVTSHEELQRVIGQMLYASRDRVQVAGFLSGPRSPVNGKPSYTKR